MSTLATAVLIASVACGPPAPPAPPEPDPELEKLYARIAQCRRDYEAGIELIVSGDAVMGANLLAAATNRMRAAAEQCALTADCDVGLFLETMDHVLEEQTSVLQEQTELIESLETAMVSAGREPGTSPFAAEPGSPWAISAMLDADGHGGSSGEMNLHEIVQLNGPVLAAIDDWLTWRRPQLMESYENYRLLRAHVVSIWEGAGFPEALLFGILATETGGKVHAYSRAGAAGPLQFMRHTGRRYGLRQVDGFDLRLDPVAATGASVRYFGDLLRDFEGSFELALAAYNCGENKVRRLRRRAGAAGLWDTRLFYSLPWETREYVPRVLAAAWLFLHPAEYGLELPDLEVSTTKIVVQEDIAIGELTICLGQEHNPGGWFRTLRNLNPRLGPGDRIEAGGQIEIPSILVPVYAERCVEQDAMLIVARKLHDANYPDEPEMVPYVVRRGDTLTWIASRHRCSSVNELAAINGIRPPQYVIHVGQRLMVPGCG